MLNCSFTGPEVIKLSSEHEIQLLIKAKMMRGNKDFSCFRTLIY